MKKSIIKINSVGDTFTYKFSYTQDDVNKFAEISGDNNPIHLDEEYASKTIFKRRIIHGFLGASVFSKIFGTIFPGYGTLYLNQSLEFYRPMFTDTEYNAQFIVKKIIKLKHRAIVNTIIVDSKNNIVIKGDALIQNENIK